MSVAEVPIAVVLIDYENSEPLFPPYKATLIAILKPA